MALESTKWLCVVALILVQTSNVLGDTPANCTFEEIRGKWIFQIGERGKDRTIDCSTLGPLQSKVKVELLYPDIAVDDYGNKGFWTLIYNQGFEVVIHGRKYFAFSMYKSSGKTAVSYCDRTLPGWTHDVLGHDWACFQGQKASSLMQKPKFHKLQQIPSKATGQLYRHNPEFINKINSVQKSWVAGHYPEYDNMTIETLIHRAGGRKSRIHGRVRPAPVTDEIRRQADALPLAFDWRNVNKINYVSPVRNQGGCGSCYAFASMAMNEARVRVMTNNTQQPVFSPQDIVECSKYSQGCEGGFPYLIGGKYAEDYGLVEEKCNPYKGKDNKCTTDPSCGRHYSTRYRYVGGYYGGCNEELMKLSLVHNGPLAVAFEVYSDFMGYKGGVYQHTGLTDKFNPFELTNHAVTLVGYGTDKATGLNYWLVKNSWGKGWGENGYFRIRRGVDECAIESVSVESLPIF